MEHKTTFKATITIPANASAQNHAAAIVFAQRTKGWHLQDDNPGGNQTVLIYIQHDVNFDNALFQLQQHLRRLGVDASKWTGTIDFFDANQASKTGGQAKATIANGVINSYRTTRLVWQDCTPPDFDVNKQIKAPILAPQSCVAAQQANLIRKNATRYEKGNPLEIELFTATGHSIIYTGFIWYDKESKHYGIQTLDGCVLNNNNNIPFADILDQIECCSQTTQSQLDIKDALAYVLQEITQREQLINEQHIIPAHLTPGSYWRTFA